mmetsp:Transcript_19197/g.46074  ORF Transcript_19197/g.46074 Transcript_19197/m.46074 type:complete len:117 (-) Transcript_19197:102-452(-)
MLVTVYTPNEKQTELQLSAVNAVAFRDQRAKSPEGERQRVAPAAKLLASMEGGAGRRVGEYDLRDPPTALSPPEKISPFSPSVFTQNEVCVSFQDNLVIGIPRKLSTGALQNHSKK